MKTMRSTIRGLLVAAFCLSPFAPAHPAYAFPSGENVTHGKVTFDRDGKRLIIHASNGSIINYVDFNIDSDEFVRFIQPGKSARVLNRIMGDDPTVILGTLLANGQVYIVNPAGVFFGNGAVVDVGGLYAAAGHISDERFLAGVNRFTDLSGSVINEGSIRGGNIHLIGSNVANHGTIKASHGIVTMLAGDEVLIRRHGERITVKVDGVKLTDQNRPRHGSTAPDMTATPGVENTGSIKANRGTVVLGAGDMYALAVRNSGTISAAKGDITIAAADGLIHNAAGGSISADANSGRAGSITVQGPSILNAGNITADSNNGRAGEVEVTSQDHTYLTDGSLISAAGGADHAEGGEILVHSYHGHTVLANGAVVDVSGGRRGGDGGFAEVSGELLTFNGYADLRAKTGYTRGSLLLDPHDIFITDTGGDDGFLDGNIVTFDEPDDSTDIAVSDEALEAIVGDITLQATGDITVCQQVDLIHDNNVTLEAQKNIFFNEAINGANNLYVLGDVDGNGHGDIFLNAPLNIGGDGVFDGARIFLNNTHLRSEGAQRYLGPVTLCVDMRLTAERVHFLSTVDAFECGGQGLRIDADRLVRFGDDVGGDVTLRYLTANVGSPSLVDRNLVIIDGNLIRAVGDIRFNPDGRNRPAEVATIAARNSEGVLIQSLDGDVFMGQNEKLTSLGDLELQALNGRITIGDLNSLGDMRVVAPDIRIRGREAGFIRNYQGGFDDDRGADFVATGSIFFSSRPDVIGGGADPIFATASGGGLNSKLDGFELLAFDGLGAVNFTFNDIVLDLTPPLGRPGDLATALTDGPTQIRDRVRLDPFALRPMERLAIYMRSLRSDELQGAVTGRELYDDAPTKPGQAPEELTVATNRLRRSSVLRVLDQYSAMFIKDGGAGEAPQDQAPFIREALSKAWTSYLDREAASGNVDPTQFRAFLQTQADHQEALTYLDGLRGLFREIWIMGATRLELRHSLNGVLGPITPQGMEQAQLEQAIQIESLG